MNEPAGGTGASVRRREDARLVCGHGCYTGDVALENPLTLMFARSLVACGRIEQTETADALALDGVAAVFTGEDVASLAKLYVAPMLGLTRDVAFPVLARERVAAVGQPIAAVLADTPAQAQDAVETIYAEVDECDTGDDAGKDVFTGAWQRGSTETAFAGAAHVVRAQVNHPKLAPASLETRAVSVAYHADRESVTVWLSTQTPHRARTELARILGREEQSIRVIAPDVGGAFGMKASLYPEEVVAVWAAFHLRRSVCWQASRNEDFLSATHGRGTTTQGELAVSAHGQFLGLRAHVTAPLGHWLPTSAGVPAWNAARILPGAYRIDAVDVRARAVMDYRTAVGIYRGAGRPEAACLMERLVAEAAAATGIDPLVIRQRNLLEADALPFDTATGYRLDGGDYGAALAHLADAADYQGRLRWRDAARARGELAGVGLAFYVEPCGTGWESARITLNPDGSIIAATGGSSQGHGRETAYAQIVSTALDVAPERVTVVLGDTAACPAGVGALASRSTAIGGSAMLEAATRLRKRAGEPLRSDVPMTEEVIYHAEGEAWGYGAWLVSVAVDADTGVMRIESAACVDDIGKVINPMLVDGQVMGGFAQGLGEATMEAIRYDEDGQLLTGAFTDYAMPRALDVPRLQIEKTATPVTVNRLGAKGVGEAGTIGAPAAILNAAADALRPLGATPSDMPLTSLRLWQAIDNARSGSST